MNDARTDALERSVNILFARIAALEAEVARLGQVLWQTMPLFGSGDGGGNIQIASGGIPAKTGGILGSATVTLYDLNAATGMLTAGPTATAWNNSPNAVVNDSIVGTDAQGNKIAIAEFCP